MSKTTKPREVWVVYVLGGRTFGPPHGSEKAARAAVDEIAHDFYAPFTIINFREVMPGDDEVAKAERRFLRACVPWVDSGIGWGDYERRKAMRAYDTLQRARAKAKRGGK